MKVALEKKRVRLFLALGAAYLAIFGLGEAISNSDTFFIRLFNNIWLLTFLVVINYILFEGLGAYVKLNWKRILISLFLLWIIMLFYSFGLEGWRFLGVQIGIYHPVRSFTSEYGLTEFMMTYSMGTVVFFGVLRHIYDYRNLKISTQQLQIEKQLAELNYLKSQTNPHFLFNTLNNIYSLARDKSDLAPESIMRLSKILRFMLYETSGNYISVEQEIKIISDYIALEKLRYDESLSINYNHNIEDMKQALPPLLLIPLVENAFKHGVSETRAKPFVDINLSINNRQLNFIVKNSVESPEEESPVIENIGLSNLRRQLELLYRDYSLEVKQKASVFTAHLKINLLSHA